MHDDEQAEERDGAGEVEVLEREADPRREQLRQHPGQPRVHPQERLLRIHPPPPPSALADADEPQTLTTAAPRRGHSTSPARPPRDRKIRGVPDETGFRRRWNYSGEIGE